MLPFTHPINAYKWDFNVKESYEFLLLLSSVVQSAIFFFFSEKGWEAWEKSLFQGEVEGCQPRQGKVCLWTTCSALGGWRRDESGGVLAVCSLLHLHSESFSSFTLLSHTLVHSTLDPKSWLQDRSSGFICLTLSWPALWPLRAFVTHLYQLSDDSSLLFPYAGYFCSCRVSKSTEVLDHKSQV